VQLALEHFPRVIGLRDGGVFFDKPSAQVGDEDLAELYRREKETSVDS
jgi:phosphonate transport system ATP-binding protein